MLLLPMQLSLVIRFYMREMRMSFMKELLQKNNE